MCERRVEILPVAEYGPFACRDYRAAQLAQFGVSRQHELWHGLRVDLLLPYGHISKADFFSRVAINTAYCIACLSQLHWQRSIYRREMRF